MKEIEKMECLKQLGALFGSERKRLGLTQVQVAGKVGIAQAHYCMIEQGKRDAEFVTIVKICKVLDVDLTAFISNYL